MARCADRAKIQWFKALHSLFPKCFTCHSFLRRGCNLKQRVKQWDVNGKVIHVYCKFPNSWRNHHQTNISTWKLKYEAFYCYCFFSSSQSIGKEWLKVSYIFQTLSNTGNFTGMPWQLANVKGIEWNVVVVAGILNIK